MTYFFDSSNILLDGVDLLTRREMFRQFNDQRVDLKCSANQTKMNNQGELLAVRCNCGKKIYHPVVGGDVIWKQIISPRNLQSLKKLPLGQALAILQD